MTTVQVINIKANGSDKAVFLNGQYILSADPGAGDNLESVNSVARSLARIYSVEINYLNVSPEKDWSWNDEFISSALKHAQNTSTEIHFDIKTSDLFKDYLQKTIGEVNHAAEKANVSPKGFAIDNSFCDCGEIEVYDVVEMIDECASHFGCVDSENYEYIVNALCEEVTNAFNVNMLS